MVNRRDIFKYVAAVPAVVLVDRTLLANTPKDIKGPIDTDSREYDVWLDSHSKDEWHLD
ncbi:MAG: hypothetical protein IMF01_06675 [Proteobacteria bacterium]|nr:hypothetical protein [Pseudomonadota bacterium]